MNKVFILFLFIFSFEVLALEGIVLPLEAPVFFMPDKKTKISHYIRKGKKIYIHPKHGGKGPNDLLYEGEEERFDVVGDFYTTLDRTGADVFILKEHVKLVLEDSREDNKNIALIPRDPMDYRLKEPLPPNYPFYHKDLYRLDVAFEVGPQRKLKYEYDMTSTSEKHLPRGGFSVVYAKTVNAELANRFFFGLVTNFYYQGSEFEFKNYKSVEEKYSFGAGPYVCYDFYRTEDSRFTIGGGATLNLAYANLTLTNTLDDSHDSKSFAGMLVAPEISGFYQKSIPFLDMAFFAGTKMYFELPHTLSTTGESLSISMGSQFMVMVGLQFIATQ